MKILGISCYYHDAAACLLVDGKPVAAAQEERFSRKRHDADFPRNAVAYCLKQGGLTVRELDAVGFYDKPLIKFERLLQTYIATYPKGLASFYKAIPLWLRKKIWMLSHIRKELDYQGAIYFGEHHLSHAASAFYASGFEDAAILTADGVGEWATTSLAVGKGSEISILEEIHFPHSLGLLYSAFTYFLGFKVNSDEYKVMGLAPYGKPRFQDMIFEHLMDLREDGSFKLNLKYFTFPYGLKMTGKRFERLFGIPAREPGTQPREIHSDLAASIQKVTEAVMMKMAVHAYEVTKSKRLCLAGGVALNCVANGKILREGPFSKIFIQPAAGDAGGAYGVASLLSHALFKEPRTASWPHTFWGPEYPDHEVRAMLENFQADFEELDETDLIQETAQMLYEGKVVGWFQGRMEFGPRALGHRSILANPMDPQMKDTLNLKVKFREGFRPFAPVVLQEHASEYFDLPQESPYMLVTASVDQDKRPLLPAVTHVDGSARVQTLDRDTNPLLYDLIERFSRLSGVPVLINTSLNVQGEPIVCTPEEAWRCFMKTNLDALMINRFLLRKEDQTLWKKSSADLWLETAACD